MNGQSRYECMYDYHIVDNLTSILKMSQFLKNINYVSLGLFSKVRIVNDQKILELIRNDYNIKIYNVIEVK